MGNQTSKTSDRKTSREQELSCVDCGVLNCESRDSYWPEFCLTKELTKEELDEVLALYDDPENNRIACFAAEVESDFYCRYTRVEEIMEFAKRMGYRRIGIATCAGLIRESRIFAQILRKHGFEPFGAVCKIGSVEKTRIGIKPEYTKKTGPIMCNPILQAKRLEKAETELNVVVGLCVGHDTLFYKYSKAPVTTLITKDRVLGHNPAAALYQTDSYYRRLRQEREPMAPSGPDEDKDQ